MFRKHLKRPCAQERTSGQACECCRQRFVRIAVCKSCSEHRLRVHSHNCMIQSTCCRSVGQTLAGKKDMPDGLVPALLRLRRPKLPISPSRHHTSQTTYLNFLETHPVRFRLLHEHIYKGSSCILLTSCQPCSGVPQQSCQRLWSTRGR